MERVVHRRNDGEEVWAYVVRCMAGAIRLAPCVVTESGF